MIWILWKWASGLESYHTAVAFTPDQQSLIVTTNYGGNYFYDLSDLDNPKQKTDHEDYTEVVVASPDGKTLATGSFDNTIRLWHLTDPDLPSEVIYNNDLTVKFLAFSPDGQILASALVYGSEILLWDLGDSPPSYEELDTGEYNDLALVEFSPDGKHLVAVDQEEKVYIWDLSNLDRGPRFLIDTND